MKILEKLSIKLSNKVEAVFSPRIPRWLIFSFLAGGAIGFLDSVYLTVEHYSGSPVRCFIIKGCNKVLASAFSEIWGTPVALLGAFYYFLLIFLVIAYIDTKKEFFAELISRLTVAGFIMSLWFLFVQFFIIKAVCIYCLVSAAISTILFFFGLVLLKILNRETHLEKFRNIIKKAAAITGRVLRKMI